MFKLFLTLAVLCFVATSFAQTFQYSHGWTNGKRTLNDIPEVYVIQQDGDHSLERCVLQLQHFLRNPLQIRAGLQDTNSDK